MLLQCLCFYCKNYARHDFAIQFFERRNAAHVSFRANLSEKYVNTWMSLRNANLR
jgi:hypothetical protein